MRNITNSNCPSACYGSYGKIVKGLLLSMAIVLFNLTYVNAQNASTQSNSQTTVIVNGQTMDVVDLEDYIPTTAGKGLVAKNLPPSAPNPGLAENMSCSNLRVAFILDESRSIITRNGVDQVKEAALGLAEAFQGSPAFLSIIEFDEQARVIDLGTNNVSGTFISNLESYLYDEDGYNDQTYAPAPVAGSGCLQGYTNWEDALLSIDADINL